MRELGAAILIVGSACALGAWAEERPVPELRKVLIIETIGPRASDAVHLDVTLKDESGENSLQFPSVVGPVFFSVQNSQLFSCESNSTVATQGALAFDLSGNQAFIFPHRGYLRDCGVTIDHRLYWLVYNVVTKSGPTNLIAILDSKGVVVAEAEFPESREFEFSVGGKTYILTVPKAHMPG